MCPRAGKKSRSNDSENVFFFLLFFPLADMVKKQRVTPPVACQLHPVVARISITVINNPSFKRGKTTWAARQVMTLKVKYYYARCISRIAEFYLLRIYYFCGFNLF